MAESDGIDGALDILSRKWHPRIIDTLLKKKSAKFSELKKDIDGISNKSLAEGLSDLEEEGVIKQKETESGDAYSLTEKGRGMENVLQSIKNWSSRFSGNSRPEILITEDDEQQSRLYSRWLQPAYSISTARKKTEFYDEIDEATDLVLLDRELEDTTARTLMQESQLLQDKPVIIITGREAEDEIIDMEISSYLMKPISEDKLKEEVSKVLDLENAETKMQKLAALLEKKEALERKRPIKNNEEYSALLDGIEKLSNEVDEEKIEQIRN